VKNTSQAQKINPASLQKAGRLELQDENPCTCQVFSPDKRKKKSHILISKILF